MSPRSVKRQIAIFVYLFAAAVVLVGADLVYFDATDALSPLAAAPSTADSPPPAQCELDPSKSPVDNQGRSLVNFQDITKGSADAGVTVIEYFDPNCPHCKDFHQVMKQLVANHSEDVRFVYKPFPLRRSSLPEIQALYVAAQSGKFTEMLEGQYARQNRSGISMSDLRSIASEIGMDPEVLSNRIEQNEYRDQVLQQRKRAVKIGVDSTPTVLVNGHFVASRTQECMNTFIEQAKSGTLSASASEQPSGE
jgi:protein-disulfide isomerase